MKAAHEDPVLLGATSPWDFEAGPPIDAPLAVAALRKATAAAAVGAPGAIPSKGEAAHKHGAAMPPPAARDFFGNGDFTGGFGGRNSTGMVEGSDELLDEPRWLLQPTDADRSPLDSLGQWQEAHSLDAIAAASAALHAAAAKESMYGEGLYNPGPPVPSSRGSFATAGGPTDRPRAPSAAAVAAAATRFSPKVGGATTTVKDPLGGTWQVERPFAAPAQPPLPSRLGAETAAAANSAARGAQAWSSASGVTYSYGGGDEFFEASGAEEGETSELYDYEGVQRQAFSSQSLGELPSPEDFLGIWVDLEGNLVKVYSVDAWQLNLVAALSRPQRPDLQVCIRRSPYGGWRCGSFDLDPLFSSQDKLTWYTLDGRISVWRKGRQ